MSRLARSALLWAALIAAPAPSYAQLLAAGAGPVWPTGDFDDQYNPGQGLLLSGRVNLGVFPFLQLQFELATLQGLELASGTATPSDLSLTTLGANLALHFIRVGTFRPYALAGVFGSQQSVSGAATEEDDEYRVGYQAGLGLDIKLGPLTPFAEFRWASVDAPGDIRYTYSPLLLGLKIL